MNNKMKELVRTIKSWISEVLRVLVEFLKKLKVATLSKFQKKPIGFSFLYCISVWLFFGFYFSYFSRVSISSDALFQGADAVDNAKYLYTDLMKSIDERIKIYVNRDSFDWESIDSFINYPDYYVFEIKTHQDSKSVKLRDLIIQLNDYLPLEKKITLFVRMVIDKDSCMNIFGDKFDCSGVDGVTEHKSSWEIDLENSLCYEHECVAALRVREGINDHIYKYLFLDFLKHKDMINPYIKNFYGVKFNKQQYNSNLHSSIFRRGELSLSRGLYFSGVSFLTLGYGDMFPLDKITRFMVLIEGVLGVIGLGLITSVFVNKLNEKKA